MVNFNLQDLIPLQLFSQVIEIGSSAIPFIKSRDVDILCIVDNKYVPTLYQWGARHKIFIKSSEQWWNGNISIPPCWWKFHKGQLKDLSYSLDFSTRCTTPKNAYRDFLWICYWKHNCTDTLTPDEQQFAIKLHDDLEFAATCKQSIRQEFQNALKLYNRT